MPVHVYGMFLVRVEEADQPSKEFSYGLENVDNRELKGEEGRNLNVRISLYEGFPVL
jgi:hypothetical protein